MTRYRQPYRDIDAGLSGPYDRTGSEDPWFLPAGAEEAGETPSGLPSPVPARDWGAAEAGLAADLADLTFDLGRLAARIGSAGPGAVQRLALAEAAGLSWWTGDRVSGDRLALWLSYRVGAAEEDGGGLIRTAWAARQLAAPGPAPGRGMGQGRDLAATLGGVLGEGGRGDAALVAGVAEALDGLAALSPVSRGCALFHLWRTLDERPGHLRGLEAAVLGTRLAAERAQGAGMPFLPMALTGLAGLTASGATDRRLSAWIGGAQRAVLSALMTLDRVADWRSRAEAATADLQGRTPARLIAALAAHPMLAAAQAETETGASRAAVQRGFDTLAARGLVREVTGQGRFRVWAASV